MTGFGSASGEVRGGRLSLEIRTVNHRYFNPQFRLPFELSGVEAPLRERLRQVLTRGHVAVTARWLEPPAGTGEVTLDLARARQVVAAAKQLKQRLKLKGAVDLAFVARQPDVLAPRSDGAGMGEEGGAGAGAAVWGELAPLVERAADQVLEMRAREGRALALELAHQLDALAAAADAIEARAPARLTAELVRLKRAVAELAAGVQVDEQRIAVEIALQADRLDITEELVRLRAHLAACRAALATDETVGKRLGFLAQELGREVNTIGSKANDAAISERVIAMKGALEQFREQLENLE